MIIDKPVVTWHLPVGVMSAGTSWLTIDGGDGRAVRLRGSEELAMAASQLALASGQTSPAGRRTSQGGFIATKNGDNVLIRQGVAVATVPQQQAEDLLFWLSRFVDCPEPAIDPVGFIRRPRRFLLVFGQEKRCRLLLEEAKALALELAAACGRPPSSTRETLRLAHDERTLAVFQYSSGECELFLEESGQPATFVPLSRAATGRLAMRLAAGLDSFAAGQGVTPCTN